MILAIDDDGGRYDYLRKILDEAGDARGGDAPELVVATCQACVVEHLPRARAVLLDFDLDGRESCVRCEGRIDLRDSTTFLDAIVTRRVPVIVSSCSSPPNRKYLFNQLQVRGVKVTAIAADHFGVEREWLGTLWTWGVL